jgi:hypothetical protein
MITRRDIEGFLFGGVLAIFVAVAFFGVRLPSDDAPEAVQRDCRSESSGGTP